MKDKVTNIREGREPTLPAAEIAAAVAPAKIPETSMMEAELAVVAKVPAPKI